MAHDLSMLGLSVLLIGHVYFTFLYDAFSAMRTGFVTEEYARMEHAKWLAALPGEAFSVVPGISNGAEAVGREGSAAALPKVASGTEPQHGDTKPAAQ
jgi:hypothetical protein